MPEEDWYDGYKSLWGFDEPEEPLPLPEEPEEVTFDILEDIEEEEE